MYDLAVKLTQPFTPVYFLLLLGVVLLWWRRTVPRRRLILVTVAFVLLTIVCWPPVSYLAVATLEWQNPPLLRRPPEATTIVVLSGGSRPPDSVRPEAHLAADSIMRCLHAADLYLQDPCPVVATGGKVDWDTPGPTLAELMRDFMVRVGVSPEDITIENRSSSTYENARFTAEILKQRGVDHVLLVTDPVHLPRATLCFEKQGIQVTGSGAYYRATEFDWSPKSFFPTPSGAGGIQSAAHEWLGMIWYWLNGRI